MSGWALRCERLWKDCAGIAALEFALIAPVMATMGLATLEVVNAFRVQAKLNFAAGQLVQMIAGQASVTEGSAVGPGGTLGDMCTAISYNMRPYNPRLMSAYIESTTVIQSFGALQTAQDWANDQSCPSSIPMGSFYETLTLTAIADTPRSLFTKDGVPKGSGGTLVAGYSAISLQLTYIYTNALPIFMGSTITFTANAAARPRANATISCTYPSGPATAACPGVY